MRRFASLPILLFLLPLLACSSPRTVYEVDPAFHQVSGRTVAQDPRTDRVVIREGMRPVPSAPHLRAALHGLSAHGYAVAPAETADLWLSVFVLAEGAGGPALHREAGQGGRGGGDGHRGNRGARHGGEGGEAEPLRRHASGRQVILIQLSERSSGRPLWQGETTVEPGKSAGGGDPDDPESVVTRLLEPLPRRP